MSNDKTTTDQAREWMREIEDVDRFRGHRFLPPQAIVRKVPALRSQDGKGYEATAHVRYFFGSGGVAYVTEWDLETGEAFGWVTLHGDEGELGYFSLHEYGTARRGLMPSVERDLWFKPRPLKDCKEVRAS